MDSLIIMRDLCLVSWCFDADAVLSGPQAQLEAQKATQDFQRATEVLRAAKETISLAEQRLLEEDNRQFDSAWQEMLNHATQRVRPSLGLRGAGGRLCEGRVCG